MHVKLQALKRFALFNQNQKYEDAVEAYGKAGNCFKVRGCMGYVYACVGKGGPTDDDNP